MNKLITLLAVVWIITSAFATIELNSYSAKTLPDITIQDLEGNKVNISDHGKNGKITVINFWATWCGPCKKELSNINELFADWQERYDMEFLAISIDDARNTAKVKSYANGQGWEFDVLLDMNQDLKRAMNFQTPPHTVLVDQSGNIVFTHTGYKEGDEYILEEEIAALSD
ncbi:MAG: TlpA family protein disulfide reductase [Chitinophagales bacterium]|nr:TlpA family protein disulfide reductase [Chitinophagales bacterium]